MHHQIASLQSGVLGNVHLHTLHSSTYTSNHHHANFAGEAKGEIEQNYFLNCENDDPHHVGTGGKESKTKFETTKQIK